MNTFLIFIGTLVVILGVFFQCDCDLYLFFASDPPKQSFSGKVVWITGASSGIGAVLTEKLAYLGAQTVISARRVDKLDYVATAAAFVGLNPLVIPLDVTDFNAHENAYNLIIEKFGRVDILVLNAGRSQRMLALETDLKDTEDLLKLNFLSYVSLTKTVLPDMIKNGGGQLMVTSSLSGKIGTPVASSYSATKYALHGYYDALRSEVTQHNVTVGLVCPGPVYSEISDSALKADGVVAPPEQKMETERCVDLMVRGLHYKVDEMWVAPQPFLFITYLNVYAPWLARQLSKRVLGPARVKALKAGENMYDMKGLLGFGSTAKSSPPKEAGSN